MSQHVDPTANPAEANSTSVEQTNVAAPVTTEVSVAHDQPAAADNLDTVTADTVVPSTVDATLPSNDVTVGSASNAADDDNDDEKLIVAVEIKNEAAAAVEEPREKTEAELEAEKQRLEAKARARRALRFDAIAAISDSDDDSWAVNVPPTPSLSGQLEGSSSSKDDTEHDGDDGVVCDHAASSGLCDGCTPTTGPNDSNENEAGGGSSALSEEYRDALADVVERNLSTLREHSPEAVAGFVDKLQDKRYRGFESDDASGRMLHRFPAKGCCCVISPPVPLHSEDTHPSSLGPAVKKATSGDGLTDHDEQSFGAPGRTSSASATQTTRSTGTSTTWGTNQQQAGTATTSGSSLAPSGYHERLTLFVHMIGVGRMDEGDGVWVLPLPLTAAEGATVIPTPVDLLPCDETIKQLRKDPSVNYDLLAGNVWEQDAEAVVQRRVAKFVQRRRKETAPSSTGDFAVTTASATSSKTASPQQGEDESEDEDEGVLDPGCDDVPAYCQPWLSIPHLGHRLQACAYSCRSIGSSLAAIAKAQRKADALLEEYELAFLRYLDAVPNHESHAAVNILDSNHKKTMTPQFIASRRLDELRDCKRPMGSDNMDTWSIASFFGTDETKRTKQQRLVFEWWSINCAVGSGRVNVKANLSKIAKKCRDWADVVNRPKSCEEVTQGVPCALFAKLHPPLLMTIQPLVGYYRIIVDIPMRVVAVCHIALDRTFYVQRIPDKWFDAGVRSIGVVAQGKPNTALGVLKMEWDVVSGYTGPEASVGLFSDTIQINTVIDSAIDQQGVL